MLMSASLQTVAPAPALSTTVEELAEFLTLTPEVITQAHQNVKNGTAAFLVVSGKLASGKDTVAPALLETVGYPLRTHLYYAQALKDEVNQIIDDIHAVFALTPVNDESRAAFAERISELYNLPAFAADLYSTALVDEVMTVEGLTARSRTEVMRTVLQQHGTNVRRAQDEHYWVKISLRPAITALADGSSVFYTDARFPNEIDWAHACGAFSLRLDVSREVQLDRLSSRDGLAMPSLETLEHDSETALDDYANFSCRLNNDGSLSETLALASTAFSSWR
jgi:hypothetical protein